MARYKLNSYQFGIVSGIKQETSDRISSAMPGNLFAPEARKGQLLILTEPVNDSGSGNEACTLVAKTITDEYYKDGSFSITASLRKAIITANSQLYEYNFKAPNHQRTAVGLSCVVLRQNDLYLGQVQPTQAYIAHKGQLRTLPVYPSWDPVAAAATTSLRPNALGTSLFSEPELYRNVVEPGDVVVLCSSRLAHVLGRSDAERLFCLVDTASALEELYQVAYRNSLSEAHLALLELVPLIDSAAQKSPLSAEGISERGKAAMSVVGDWISDVTSNAALTLRKNPSSSKDMAPSSEDDAHDQPLALSSHVQPTSALTMDTEIPPVLDDIDPQDMNWLRERPRYRPKTHADVETWPASALLGEQVGALPSEDVLKSSPIDLTDQLPLPIDFAAIPQRDPLPQASFMERVFRPIYYVLAAFMAFFSRFGRSKRPSATPITRFDRTKGISYRKTPRKRAPFVIALMIPVLAYAMWYYVQTQNKQQAENSYQEVIALAQSQYQDALNAPDDAMALAHLEDMQTTLQTIQTSDLLQNDPARLSRYRALRKDSQDLAASINRTSLIPSTAINPVLTLPIADTVSELLVVPRGSETEIYVVALESGILYRQVEGTIAEPEVVLEEGTTIGPVLTAPMRSIVWRVDNLVALDRDGFSTVYLKQPDDSWIAQTLPASEFWPAQPFPDIESYGGHLYVWQRGVNALGQIQKYTSGNFANLPTDWIVDAPLDLNLPSAVDMAIDGDIYLLKPDGSILVFRNGVYDHTVAAPQLDPPLIATRMYLDEVRAIETDPNQGHFYIIDVVNQRIVEMDQSGMVLQQIRPLGDSDFQFDQLSDIYIGRSGAEGKLLYVANGNQVYQMRLPDPPPVRSSVSSPLPNDSGGVPTPTP